MSDKRFQVFVSSTYTDLIEERQAVLSALLQLDAIPSGMELFPAYDKDAWSLIEKMIDNCDYYVLVVGGKYGSCDSNGLGFTEKEYDYAVSTEKPVMAFLHGNPGDISAAKSEATDEGKSKLTAFRAKVELAKHVKFWTTPDDLAGKVALSYTSFIKSFPAVGWVRADGLASTSALSEIHTLRAEIDQLQAQLESARTTAPPGTGDLVQGGDEFPIAAKVTVAFDGPVLDADGDEVGFRLESIVSIRCTWNDVLSIIGPRMLDEGSERAVRLALLSRAEYLFWESESDIPYLARLTESGFDLSVANLVGIQVHELTDESFNQVVIQMLALGLIAKGKRNRGVADRNTYWMLTPYGHSEVVKLMAVRRSDAKLRTASVDGGDSDA